MNKGGPIIIIEDDLDDQEILNDVFKELDYKNEIIFFSDGEKALDYLTASTVEPFIIFSDINMPKLNLFLTYFSQQVRNNNMLWMHILNLYKVSLLSLMNIQK